jgi:hypothetical protein
MEFVPDCLVLKIEERCRETGDLVTTFFILYDKKEHHYVIRGKIKDLDSDTSNKKGSIFSFVSRSSVDLEEFLSFSICNQNKLTYVLYTFDDLPFNSNNITYEDLRAKQYEKTSYEIAGYENKSYKKKDMLCNLRMLENVFNYYN